MSDGVFEFSKRSKIILYGAASIGNIVFEILINNGYEVVGFIDKRAKELTHFNDRPVWAIGEIPREVLDDSSTLIYVSVKNVFEHDEIIRQFIREGIYNLVYKPYSVLQGGGSDKEQRISEIYDAVINDRFDDFYLVPRTIDVVYVSGDCAFIKEVDDSVVAYIPAEFIFTNDYVDTPMEKWGNINVLAFFTHIGFWKSLLEGNCAGFRDYVDEYCVFTAQLANKIKITEAWKENVIRNRIQIFEHMKLNLETDPLFFVRSAATAEWNENGYFNLTSGKHRTTFLAAYGYQYIPIKMKKNDYNKFLNEQTATTVSIFLRNMDYAKVETTIPHPYFYKQSQIKENGYYIFLKNVVDYLSRKIYKKYGCVDFSRITVCDCIEENCNLVRLLFRMGSNVYRKYEATGFKHQMDLLFNSKRKLMINKLDKYDMAFYKYDKFLDSIVDDGKLVKADFYFILQARISELDKICNQKKFNIIKRISYNYEEREVANYLIEASH